jgi:hypothetical protein
MEYATSSPPCADNLAIASADLVMKSGRKRWHLPRPAPAALRFDPRVPAGSGAAHGLARIPMAGGTLIVLAAAAHSPAVRRRRRRAGSRRLVPAMAALAGPAPRHALLRCVALEQSRGRCPEQER